MSLITKPKAIIYCAENTISGKKYVGRTLRTLEIRKADHFTKTVRSKHRFATALRCYPRESWKFYTLAEVDYDKADEYEQFFIADLDTCNPLKGYNTLPGGSLTGEGSPTYNPEICSVYHPSYGLISGTRSELMKMYPELEKIRILISNYKKSLKGWVLAENKDNYELFISSKKPRGELVTLAHPELGTYTLFQKEFVTRFGLRYQGLASLIKGEQKSHKNWKLIKEKTDGYSS